MNGALEVLLGARDLVAGILLGAGVFFCVVGSLGVIRFPDFYTRLHAAGVTDTGGSLLILFGLGVLGGGSFVTVKLVLIGLFLLITAPTASHALAQAAHSGGLEPIIGGRMNKAKPDQSADSVGGQTP